MAVATAVKVVMVRVTCIVLTRSPATVDLAADMVDRVQEEAMAEANMEAAAVAAMVAATTIQRANMALVRTVLVHRTEAAAVEVTVQAIVIITTVTPKLLTNHPSLPTNRHHRQAEAIPLRTGLVVVALRTIITEIHMGLRALMEGARRMEETI